MDDSSNIGPSQEWSTYPKMKQRTKQIHHSKDNSPRAVNLNIFFSYRCIIGAFLEKAYTKGKKIVFVNSHLNGIQFIK